MYGSGQPYSYYTQGEIGHWKGSKQMPSHLFFLLYSIPLFHFVCPVVSITFVCPVVSINDLFFCLLIYEQNRALGGQCVDAELDVFSCKEIPGLFAHTVPAAVQNSFCFNHKCTPATLRCLFPLKRHALSQLYLPSACSRFTSCSWKPGLGIVVSRLIDLLIQTWYPDLLSRPNWSAHPDMVHHMVSRLIDLLMQGNINIRPACARTTFPRRPSCFCDFYQLFKFLPLNSRRGKPGFGGRVISRPVRHLFHFWNFHQNFVFPYFMQGKIGPWEGRVFFRLVRRLSRFCNFYQNFIFPNLVFGGGDSGHFGPVCLLFLK